ncbi:Piso0_003042 [Millerozyma farinosa CBS 7064]|uniref:Piso0_003042 protein n=1 Tax=Pichia sorbitophila (strain ATCC MYA-4447 / BCRC 22081 / CBS 7064 / NBRC 10061 / NRRL Y-12695) TaxID=559304 RepID=G8YK69_PICSO|nr:Piso0_003042 [Millerozyma farinosa CBS 7064]CCE80714.1 Piso0_003042 [Millerozyma farinosa CBS 7064]
MQRRFCLAIECKDNASNEPQTAFLVDLNKCEPQEVRQNGYRLLVASDPGSPIENPVKEDQSDAPRDSQAATSRRYSLCDLNTLDSEGSEESSPVRNKSTKLCCDDDVNESKPDVESPIFPSSFPQARRHNRRRSVALKFQSPKFYPDAEPPGSSF